MMARLCPFELVPFSSSIATLQVNHYPMYVRGRQLHCNAMTLEHPFFWGLKFTSVPFLSSSLTIGSYSSEM